MSSFSFERVPLFTSKINYVTPFFIKLILGGKSGIHSLVLGENTFSITFINEIKPPKEYKVLRISA
jgi:hypothetical protein